MENWECTSTFFAFLCISLHFFVSDKLISGIASNHCHCINLECSKMPGSATISFNSKNFMLLSDHSLTNLNRPHSNRHQPKLKEGFWQEYRCACLVCMRPIWPAWCVRSASATHPGQAVVLNCRKLASTQISTAQYITSLPINLFPDISTASNALFTLFVL